MAARFDLVAASFAGVADSAGVWRFIRGFVAGVSRPLAVGDGCHDDELRLAEDRLQLRLPTAMREAYGLLGCRDDLTRVQDRLLGPDELRVDSDGRMLVFRVENQHVAEWGVPLAAVEQPDPPVVFRAQVAGPLGRRWLPFLDRFSLAWMEMVLSESLMSNEDLSDNRELDDRTVEVLERDFVRLGLPEYPLWAEPGGGAVRWFSDGDVVLREDGRIWLWGRTQTAAGLDRARRVLPGDWLMADSLMTEND